MKWMFFQVNGHFVAECAEKRFPDQQYWRHMKKRTFRNMFENFYHRARWIRKTSRRNRRYPFTSTSTTELIISFFQMRRREWERGRWMHQQQQPHIWRTKIPSWIRIIWTCWKQNKRPWKKSYIADTEKLILNREYHTSIKWLHIKNKNISGKYEHIFEWKKYFNNIRESQ